MIVLPVVVFVALMIAWLWAGRTLTLAVDWMVSFPVRSLAASPLSYRGIDFHLGGERLTVIMLNHEHADLQVATDTQNWVVFSMGRDAFVLGPRTNPVDPKDPLNVEFGFGRPSAANRARKSAELAESVRGELARRKRGAVEEICLLLAGLDKADGRTAGDALAIPARLLPEDGLDGAVDDV